MESKFQRYYLPWILTKKYNYTGCVFWDENERVLYNFSSKIIIPNERINHDKNCHLVIHILLCLYVSGEQVWYLTSVLENSPLFSLKLMWICVCFPPLGLTCSWQLDFALSCQIQYFFFFTLYHLCISLRNKKARNFMSLKKKKGIYVHVIFCRWKRAVII